YAFAQSYLKEQEADDDEIPLIRPEAGGVEGAAPVLREFSRKDDESAFIVKCLQRWQQQGRAWRDIAIVYRSYSTGVRLAKALETAGIPYLLTHDKAAKESYDPAMDRVSLL